MTGRVGMTPVQLAEALDDLLRRGPGFGHIRSAHGTPNQTFSIEHLLIGKLEHPQTGEGAGTREHFRVEGLLLDDAFRPASKSTRR